jgi:hypothetical protein
VLTALNNDINYVAAKNFLNNLGQAVTILSQPDAAKYVNGTYSAQGHTVEQLVAYMTQNGLQFAPAVAGQDGAYESLYQSLRAYAER